MYNIVTPCSRPQNIARIKQSLEPFADKITWYIVYDSTKRDIQAPEMHQILVDTIAEMSYFPWIKQLSVEGGVTGSSQRNAALDLITNGYVYFLDDDNIIHPNLLTTIESMPSIGASSRAYVFSQQLEGGIRMARYSDIRQTHIDTAQYLLDRSLIDGLRFNHHYCADGEFIENLYLDNPQDFVVIEDILCYYNKLRWEK